VRIIEVENPTSALIFCNTKARVEYVSRVLQRFGYDADQISSDLSQNARDRVMERIRQSTLRFLVATDVAARGIDLPELSHVIQYEPPEDQEAYIHRAGRTGRAGSSGTAISLVNTLERTELQRIGRRYKIDFQELETPGDEDVERVVSERTIALLEAQLRSRDRLQNERMARFLALPQQLIQDEGVDLLAMLLDDFYQDAFHGPVAPVAPPEQARKNKGGGSNRKRSRRPRRKNRG
jgi:ATP-dependent RNA helicase DeaD